MGYNTRFELKVQEVDGNLTLTNREVWALQREIELHAGFDPGGVFDREEGVRWYDYDETMLKISKKYPHYVFSVYGVGDDGSSDTWVHYFHNGRGQYYQVSFPKFDLEAMRGIESC